MATTKPFNQASLDTALKTQKALQDKLAGSSSAYTDENASPSDLSTDIQLQTINKTISNLQSQKEKERWYPVGTDDVTTQGKPKESLLNRVLKGLGAPLRFEVGAVESMLGGGEGKGILENAKYNMSTGGKTYGDLMKEGGVPNWIASPAGFALDVIGDPINVASMGTASLVGKVGMGAIKGVAKEGIMGGLKGVGTGAVSSIGGDTLGLVRAIPKIGKDIAETGVYKKLATKVAEKGMAYDALTGVDQVAKAGTNFMGLTDVREGGFTIGKGLESLIKEIPGGDSLIEKFKYSPADWFEKTKAIDSFHKIMEKEGVNTSIPIDLTRVAQMMDNPINEALSVKKVLSSYERENIRIGKMIADSDYIAKTGTEGSFMVADGATELESRLAQEAIENEAIRDSIKQFAKLNRERTGIDWYDKTSKFITDNVSKFKIGNVELGKKMLTAVGISDDIFKSGKVMLNPASRVNANAGNVLFTTIYGFDPLRVYLANSGAGLKATKAFIEGNDMGEFALKNLFQEMSDFSKFAAQNPNAVIGSLGMSASSMGGRTFLEQMVKQGKIMGLIDSSESEASLIKQIMGLPDELRTALEDTAGISAEAAKTGGAFETIKKSLKAKKDSQNLSSLEVAMNRIKEAPTSSLGSRTTYLGNEISDINIKKFYEIKQEWAKKAAEGSTVHKILDGLVTKQMDKFANKFELVDQSHKLNLSVYMTKTGITESELRAIAKNVKDGITDEDILWHGYENGQKVFKLSWNKATQIADDVYMNYAAMPPFVRMMRSAAIVGMPFGSFTYGATTKMAKNIVNNPQLINKVNFAKEEFAGQKSPIEKAALDTPYYSWYDSPSMMKLPFFTDHPTYLNLANWIPYYSLNMFSPSQRNYTDDMLGGMASTIDKLGFFKTPAGQVLWDYGFGPFLATGDASPQTQFGSALYPLKSTGLEKLGYATRSFLESYTPTILAPAGLAVPEQFSKYIPLYQGRKFAEAKAGKNEQGILKANRTPLGLVAETASSWAGVPIKPLDLNTLTNTIKKSNK